MRATAAQTGGAFGLVDIETPPGAGPPPHRHTREHEVLVVLRGNLLATIASDERNVESGQLVHLPRGVDHGHRAGLEPLRHLDLVKPAGFERFFVEVRAPTDDGPRAIDQAELRVVASRYGVTHRGPPRV